LRVSVGLPYRDEIVSYRTKLVRWLLVKLLERVAGAYLVVRVGRRRDRLLSRLLGVAHPELLGHEAHVGLFVSEVGLVKL
jgi:hypothetical protein